MKIYIKTSKDNLSFCWIAENKLFKVYGDTRQEVIDLLNACMDEPDSDFLPIGSNDTSYDANYINMPI